MLSFTKFRFTGKRKNVFFFFIILIIASSSVYGQRIFRPIDPNDPYARYGKSPYSEPPFLHFGTTSYTYKISSSLYNSHLSYVDAAFTSWNNCGPVKFSRIIYGLPLTAQAQNYDSWGPAWSYPSWNPNTYVLTPDNGSIVLNSSGNVSWSHTEQHLNASPHVIDVQTMVVHEAGHIMGLAHPLTDSYTHDATAPTMAGGDNEYFDNTLDCRSLETEDIYGTQFLQLRVPYLYGSLQTAINKAAEVGIGYVYLMSNTTLSSDIISSSPNVNLIIQAGVTLNLNNHSLILANGSISVENGATINGSLIKLKSGATLKGLSSSLQTTLDNASSGYTIEISSGTFNENVTVYFKNNITILGADQYTTFLSGTQQFYWCDNLDIEALYCQQINAYSCNNCRLIYNVVSQGGIGLYSCTNFDCGSNDIISCTTGFTAAASSGY